MKTISIPTMKAICKHMGFQIDPVYHYIVDDKNHTGYINYNGKTYCLEYVSGCFFPYLFEV